MLSKLKNRHFGILWLAFHLSLLVFFLIFGLKKNTSLVNTDLFNIIPKSIESEPVAEADKKLLDTTSRNVFVLVVNEDFSRCRNTAVQVYNALNGSSNFDAVSLYNDTDSLSEIIDFVKQYRFSLLDEDYVDAVEADGGESAIDEALSSVFGAFTILPIDDLQRDPFLLTEHNIKNYLLALQGAGTAMSVKDGVLASEFEGKWYVMIRCVLSTKGAAMASKTNGVSEIYKVCQPIENEANGTSFVYSGTAFHSHHSSLAASREITIISVVSLIAVIAMLLLVFKSAKPLLFSVLSIGVSVASGFLGTVIFFHQMTVITLVFGTCLIGSSIDYSLHFFVQWAGNKKLLSGSEIRNHLLPELSMAIFSSGLCFAVLLFAPFELLKQMSVFCLFGLFSSFLTTICVYPMLKLPAKTRNLKTLRLPEFRHILLLLGGVSVLFVAIFHKNIKIKNNISGLYKMQGRLLSDEMLASKIIQYSPSGWFIVSGNSPEETLQNEEKLRNQLKREGISDGYLCTTLFIPSEASQIRSLEASKKLAPLSQGLYEIYGYTEQESQNLSKMMQKLIDAVSSNKITMENNTVPQVLMQSISTVWLGNIGEKYYSVLVPNKTDRLELFKAAAGSSENVFFVSKAADISEDLDKLTRMVLVFFAVALVLMAVILKFFYSTKQMLRIISVPLFVVLVICAFFAAFDISFEFFSITGLVLVFGLGLDYIVYMIENEKRSRAAVKSEENQLSPFATLLSFVTTILSFGALALSSFMPVHLIGLSIVIGLTTAFIIANAKLED